MKNLIETNTLPELMQFAESKEYIESVNFKESFQGFKDFEAMKKSFNKPIERKGQNRELVSSLEVTHDKTGFTPDVARFLAGDPEDMFCFDTQEQNEYHELNIYLSLVWSVDAKEITKNGLSLLEQIQNKTTVKDKFKVNFISVINDVHKKNESSKKVRNNLITTTVLTGFNDYLTEPIINLLCSPAMFRYYQIAAFNKHFGATTDIYNGSIVTMEEANNLTELKGIKLISFMQISKTDIFNN